MKRPPTVINDSSSEWPGRSLVRGVAALITSLPVPSFLKACPHLGGNESKACLKFQPEYVIGIILILLISLTSCQQVGNAPKLQSHLQAARVASDQTGEHIVKTRTAVERADYKAGRALKLINEGFTK